MQTEAKRSSAGRVPRPAIPVLVGFAAGIVIDRWCGIPWELWLGSGLLLMVCWVACWMRAIDRVGSILLLAACCCLGGARHTLIWSVARSDAISLFAREEPRPVRLTGTIVTSPYIAAKNENRLQSAWPQYDRTLCTVHCHALLGPAGPMTVSGLVRLDVTGHLLHVQVGDHVEVHGHLSQPTDPGNPGEFDFRDYLRRKKIRTIVRAEYPDAVRKIRTEEGWKLQRWRHRIREEVGQLLVNHLDRRTAPVAAALLLGSRSEMSDETRIAFAESGTMHLLAISGLHIGILAGFLWWSCRLLDTTPLTTTAILMLGMLSYALITEARPPVVRATILMTVAALGMPWQRRPEPANLWAVSALIILAWNPTDLFDVGAQLSFLAVAGILCAAHRQRKIREREHTDGDAVLEEERGWLGERFVVVRDRLKAVYYLTGAIWLFTTPLVVDQFHLVSPVGFLLNVVLIPLVAVTLWMGYGLLFCGLFLPLIADIFGKGLHLGLSGLLKIVDVAAAFQLGHFYTPAPPTWWTVGFYLILAALICFRRFRCHCFNRYSLAIWVILGLLVSLIPQKPKGLRCTFLSVGHGCSVLVEMPHGGVLLYDAGMINNANRAQQVIQQAIWHRGLTGIDALIISHADIDHFNAVPGLLRSLSIGRLLVAPSFLDHTQSETDHVRIAAATSGVPVQTIQQGDRLRIDSHVSLQILHPAADFHSEHDNENSLVLLMEYGGRKILLTGDVEGEGLRTLLRQPASRVDVLLAPHHGSLGANPPELVGWAQPTWSVVSGGRPDTLRRLPDIYGEACQVLSTRENGAVTFEIDRRDFSVTVSCFRKQPPPATAATPRQKRGRN